MGVSRKPVPAKNRSYSLVRHVLQLARGALVTRSHVDVSDDRVPAVEALLEAARCALGSIFSSSPFHRGAEAL
jgi:hypothetical protein